MFSLLIPLDSNRLKQFQKTKERYDSFPQTKELLILTREEKKVSNFLKRNGLMKDVKLISYTVDKGFNCSKALNLGVKNAQYNQIIVTCPEVLPVTDVLPQLESLIGQNIVCKVFGEGEDGEITTLVSETHMNNTPEMYFLAMFNKQDIETINGWDEDFMLGYAYEDNDFGVRWVRAGLPFRVRDDIVGRHQYHPRKETIENGLSINRSHYEYNNDNAVICPKNGLVKDV